VKRIIDSRVYAGSKISIRCRKYTDGKLTIELDSESAKFLGLPFCVSGGSLKIDGLDEDLTR
jgi:hypothetical protein